MSTRDLPGNKIIDFVPSFSSPRMDAPVKPAILSNRISSDTFCATSHPFVTAESTVLAETVPPGMAANACSWLCRSWRKNLFSVGKVGKTEKLSISGGEYVKLIGAEGPESDFDFLLLDLRFPP